MCSRSNRPWPQIKQGSEETIVSASVKAQLGLVCITASDAVRYRTTTRKSLLQLEPAQQKEKLRSIYTDNILRVHKAADFCLAHGIKLYRLTSQLFPFADDPAGEDLLNELAGDIRRAGDRFNQHGIRMVLHPDQFVMLNSDSPHVVENSLKMKRSKRTLRLRDCVRIGCGKKPRRPLKSLTRN